MARAHPRDAMQDALWLVLALKMGMSAAIVVAASMLVERSGPLVGAMIATLPISAGPNYAYLALEHGDAFVAESARTSLPVNAATAVFIVAYAVLAQRFSVAVTLPGAGVAWAAAVALIASQSWSLLGALALNLAAYGAAILVARRYLAVASPPALPRRPWDLPLRAAAVMALVAAVVLAGRLVGPSAAGVAALMPVVLTSLALILHPRLGGPATAATLVHGLPGLVGFAVAILTLAVAVAPLGSAAALLLALGVSVGWNVAILALRRRVRLA